MATTYLTRVFGTPTNGKKFTFSAWMKKGTLSGDQAFFSTGNSSDPITTFRWNSDGKIYLFYLSSSSMVWEFATNSLYRDCNGWYNVVIAFDSTESSGGDRLKLWVNGEQITTWSTEVNVSLDMTPTMNTAVRHDLGTNGPGGNYFTGLMSHVHFVDGTAYPASTFGSTDATTGEWKINTNPTVTYGNNGFFLLKNDASLTDQSGEGNNFTLGGGTLTKTEDNPSNVFATINILDNFYNGLTLTNGNTSWVSGSPYSVTRSTLGASSGKYYFEMKVVNEGNTDYEFGIVGAAGTSTSSWMGKANSYGYAYESNGKLRANGTEVDPWGSTYDDGDILGCAFDLDNNKIYFSKNGSWQQSGDPSAGSNGYTIAAAADTTAGAYFVGAGDFSGSSGQSGQFNFGNGYFGTSAISSAGTNASNIGIFEYDVPTGYTALSTKGLNL